MMPHACFRSEEGRLYQDNSMYYKHQRLCLLQSVDFMHAIARASQRGGPVVPFSLHVTTKTPAPLFPPVLALTLALRHPATAV